MLDRHSERYREKLAQVYMEKRKTYARYNGKRKNGKKERMITHGLTRPCPGSPSDWVALLCGHVMIGPLIGRRPGSSRGLIDQDFSCYCPFFPIVCHLCLSLSHDDLYPFLSVCFSLPEQALKNSMGKL